MVKVNRFARCVRDADDVTLCDARDARTFNETPRNGL